MPAVNLRPHRVWGALTPTDAVALLSEFRARWWIAGGWALDLFLGKVTRTHQDLDVGIFRSDTAGVVASLSGWEFFEAKDGVLSALALDATPRAGVHSLWGKRANTAQWELE